MSQQRSNHITGATVAAFAVAAGIPALLGFAGGGYGTVSRSLAGLAVWWAVALLLALELVPRGSISRPARRGLVALAALCGWIALSAIWTEALDRTIDELARTIGYAGFAVLVLVCVDRRTWRAAAAGLLTGALLICAAALANRLAPGAFAETPVQAIFGYERLSFPLDYWNAVGCWASMTFPLALVWAIEARRGWLRALALGSLPAVGLVAYLSYSRGTLLSAIAGLAVLAVLMPSVRRPQLLRATAVALAGTAVAILVTRATPAIELGEGGEGGWLVLLVLLLYAAASAPLALREGPGERPSLGLGEIGPALALTAAAVMVGLAIAVIGGPQPAVDAPVSPVPDPQATAPLDPVPEASGSDLSEIGTPERVDPAARLGSAGGLRDVLWPSALRAFRAEPIRGTGAGTYDIWLARDAPQGEFARNAHSIYLEYAAELGIVGLAILLAMLAAFALSAVRSQRAPDSGVDGLGALGAGLIAAGAVWAVQAGVDWMWESAAIVALAFGCVLVATAARQQQAPARSAQVRRVRRRTATTKRRGRRLAIAFAVVAGAVQIPIALGSDRFQAGLDAVTAGDIATAEERLDEALAITPWSSDVLALRSVVRLGLDDTDGAREDALAATRRVPTLYRYWLVLAQVEVARGDAAAATAALERAIELRPAEADAIERFGREVIRGAGGAS